MPRTLNEVIVVDVEATCVANDDPDRRFFKSEIIEIGVAVLDLKKYEIKSNYSIYVMPERSKVTPFCTELTGITPEQVAPASGAKSFGRACELLVKKHGRQQPWGSWGDYDRTMFERQCQKGDYPFGKMHINIKTLFSLALGIDHGVGMDQALKTVDLTLDGKHHSGKDDAYNIAKLLKYLLASWGKGASVSDEVEGHYV